MQSFQVSHWLCTVCFNLDAKTEHENRLTVKLTLGRGGVVSTENVYITILPKHSTVKYLNANRFSNCDKIFLGYH
jgi:hypothetical protein